MKASVGNVKQYHTSPLHNFPLIITEGMADRRLGLGEESIWYRNFPSGYNNTLIARFLHTWNKQEFSSHTTANKKGPS